MESIKKLCDNELEKVTGGADGNDVAVNRALSQIGKPYEWGACGPDAFDASGLVSYALTGKFIHCYTEATFLSWPKVQDPQPGDVCTNGGHCGIYIGGGYMVHAPTFGQTVCTTSVQSGMIFVRCS